jgi:hypothetical protein
MVRTFPLSVFSGDVIRLLGRGLRQLHFFWKKFLQSEKESTYLHLKERNKAWWERHFDFKEASKAFQFPSAQSTCNSKVLYLVIRSSEPQRLQGLFVQTLLCILCLHR